MYFYIYFINDTEMVLVILIINDLFNFDDLPLSLLVSKVALQKYAVINISDRITRLYDFLDI